MLICRYMHLHKVCVVYIIGMCTYREFVSVCNWYIHTIENHCSIVLIIYTIHKTLYKIYCKICIGTKRFFIYVHIYITFVKVINMCMHIFVCAYTAVCLYLCRNRSLINTTLGFHSEVFCELTC